MITKATSFEAKDIDIQKGMAKIAFATFNTMDRDGDIARPGMFNKSWMESKADVRFFRNHNPNEAVGVPMELHDNGQQAIMVVKFGRHTLGQDTLMMMEDGIITDNSYGFDPVPEKTFKIKGKNGREFKEVKLWEVSVLTHWGAHPSSKVVEVGKSADMLLLANQIKIMKQFCRDTTASDYTIESILKQIEIAEKIVLKYDTAFHSEQLDEQTNEPDASVTEERAAADSLALLAMTL